MSDDQTTPGSKSGNAPPGGPPPPPTGGAEVRTLHPGLDYGNFVCPLLTAAVLKPAEKKSALVLPGQANQQDQVGDEAVACLGPKCMFYVTEGVRDEKTGNTQIISGACAMKVVPFKLSESTGALLSFFSIIEKLMLKLNIRSL